MKKATDILGETTVSQFKAVTLTGDDEQLKSLVTGHLTKQWEFDPTEIDHQEIKHGDELVELLAGGSLFGKRCLIVNLDGPWGAGVTAENLTRTLKEMGDSEDRVIIRTEKAPSSQPAIEEIDCKRPTHSKTRDKLVELRLKHHGLEADDEAKKLLRERTQQTSDLETTLRTLSLAFGTRRTLTAKDVGQATAEPAAKRDITRALLRKNLQKLSKELREGDPMYTLTVLHNNLFKLFTYIELTADKTVGEEKVREQLEIPPRAAKDWKEARKKYASKTVRNLMETTADAYEAVRSGKTGWLEEIQYQFTKLGSSDGKFE